MDSVTKAINLGMEFHIDEDDGELIYWKNFTIFGMSIRVDVSFVYNSAVVNYIHSDDEFIDYDTMGDYLVTIEKALEIIEKLDELKKMLGCY